MKRLLKYDVRYSVAFLVLLVSCLWLAHVEPVNAQNAAQDIITQQQNVSQSFDSAISEAMEELISTPVFTESANVGVFIAIAGFAPVLIQAAKVYKIDDAVDTDALIRSIFGLTLILLLLGTPTHRGRLLADVITGTNSVSNTLSGKVLKAAAGEDGVTAVAKEVVKNHAEGITEAAIEECSKIAEQSERENCFKEARTDVINTLDPYTDEQWARQTSAILQARLNTAGEISVDYGFGEWFSRTASSTGSFLYGETIKGICYVLGQVFVAGVEHVKILMAMVAPIFVGLQMVPLFRGFFTLWLKNFLMLELALMLFNIIISLAALTLIYVQDASSLIFPFLVAGLSIIFTLGLMGGGGISVYTQAVSTSVSVSAAIRGAFK